MSYERLVDGTIDYLPCRYGKSKLTFRGPRTALNEPYIAFVGGTVTYGKFVEVPYPDLLGREAGVAALNLGFVNAGIDTFIDDDTVLDLCSGARACVIEVMGANKLSNRHYSVHPRRNDRFVAASQELQRLYPEADYSEVHFTRHLLSTLHAIDARRFAAVTDELAEAWTSRMLLFIRSINVPVTLLWVSDRSPDERQDALTGSDPLFVTRDMIDAVCQQAEGCIEVVHPSADRPDEGMVFSELEFQAARELPGPAIHRQIAADLSPALRARI
ncbi:MAG: DUF6473 family protein [Pseudomonadota bacterium]